jgi:DNA-binding Xre family transcriptional regulator
MDILDFLESRREDMDIPKEKMGKLLGMSSQNYTKIIQGKNQLRLNTFLKICKILNVNPMNLINENNDNYVLLTQEDLAKLSEAKQVIEKIQRQSTKALQEITIENNPNSQINIGGTGNNNLKL